MIHRIKRTLINNVKNIPGWRTNRKIIVFECDDWGGIRMPSAKIREEMIAKGLNISESRFDKYDTLANIDDFERMFEVLSAFTDRSGNPAVITPLVVVANPDFEQIREHDFSTYSFEPFRDTLNRYYPGQDVFRMWQNGISKGLFMPELHGRDHISVPFWMQKLQEGDSDLRSAFDCGYVSLEVPGVPAPVSGFRAEYYFESEAQKDELKQAIFDGVTLFTDLFGRKPNAFVPGNGIFHPEFDEVVASSGAEFLNVFNRSPYPAASGQLKYRRFVSGNRKKVTYYTRNCAFEPSENGYGGIEDTLAQISASFRWGKPAIISSHRVNFVGSIDESIREFGLKELRQLLQEIQGHWPDVEFMSTGNMLNEMQPQNKKR